jgi:hypothetical protein
VTKLDHVEGMDSGLRAIYRHIPWGTNSPQQTSDTKMDFGSGFVHHK